MIIYAMWWRSVWSRDSMSIERWVDCIDFDSPKQQDKGTKRFETRQEVKKDIESKWRKCVYAYKTPDAKHKSMWYI